ncbi:hypothetical protein DPMN_178396 [Dreissena polymorpha]|uniref:Uncharacterized protein n=1 Tax=Dreissena polymorpha TaxID=45954 RepID=A0A9D4ILD5_DREPO|nr:hypothetical protein DPMN_178396 [Dreissena polymorpha]
MIKPRYTNTAEVPRVRTTKYGLSSFRSGAARLWNSMPQHFRDEGNYNQFRSLVASWDGVGCACRSSRRSAFMATLEVTGRRLHPRDGFPSTLSVLSTAVPGSVPYVPHTGGLAVPPSPALFRRDLWQVRAGELSTINIGRQVRCILEKTAKPAV